MRKKLKIIPFLLTLFLSMGCSLTGPQGEPGKDGHAPTINIGSNGNWYVDGVDTGVPAQGDKGDTGDQGPQGNEGDTGNGVASIEKTSTSGNVDTYTITYTNGDKTTFIVTNGTNGEQGIQGLPGQDGRTPVITIGSNGNWYVDGVDTDIHAQGDKGDTGNGIASIEKTSTSGNVDTYTITYTNGDKTTFTVTNGTNGEQGIQGKPGQDGHTPVITIGSNGNWYVDGEDTDIHAQGEKGDKGDTGDQGETGLSAYEIYLKYYPEYTGTEKEWIDDLSLGVLGEKYTITWTNYDGAVLEVDENVSRRAMVEYNGSTPQKNSDAEFSYSFSGWNPIIEPATRDVTYVASYVTNTIPNWLIEMDSTNTSAKVMAYTGTEENVVVPTSYLGKPVTSIDNNAFQGNTYLKSVVIGNSITSIGDHAFSGCSSLESITLPFVGATLNGTNNTHFGYIFGASSYSDNSKFVPSSLKKVIITNDTSIGNHAFYECTSLTSIVIPNSVTSIVEWAFYGCSTLTSIVIPNSVASIGSFVFYNCSSLTIYCEASSQPSKWNSNWNYSNRSVYWAGEWTYANGVPTPNQK